MKYSRKSTFVSLKTLSQPKDSFTCIHNSWQTEYVVYFQKRWSPGRNGIEQAGRRWRFLKIDDERDRGQCRNYSVVDTQILIVRNNFYSDPNLQFV